MKSVDLRLPRAPENGLVLKENVLRSTKKNSDKISKFQKKETYLIHVYDTISMYVRTRLT